MLKQKCHANLVCECFALFLLSSIHFFQISFPPSLLSKLFIFQNQTEENNKSLSSGRGSRNFSLSSERYIVDQINKSKNGSVNSQLHHHQPPYEAAAKHRHPSVETFGTEMLLNDHRALIVPHEDDIEKSFRVNQDGSMTVEMKVHLTIKEEEMLHWTTTVSRASLSRRPTAQASISQSGNSSPDLNNHFAKDSPSLSQDEMKEDNCNARAAKVVGFNNAQAHEDYSCTTAGKHKTEFKRTPTPGPRHVNKKASVESVKTVTELGVHESTVGHYSYMARMADGEMTEGYCVLKHSSSSSNRPIPKPRKTASAGGNKTSSLSSEKSSGAAEVLQIESNGMEVTETVMHIYENEDCHDNYYANEEYSADSPPLQGSVPAAESQAPTVSDPRSTNSDCDIDFSPSETLQRQKEDMLSLSSEPGNPVHEIRSNLPSVTESERRTASDPRIQGVVPKSEKKKRTTTPRNKKSSPSTSSSDKKQNERSPSEKTKHSSTDKIGSSKKTLSSAESVQKTKGAEKAQIKKVGKVEKMKVEPKLAGAKPVAVKKTQFQKQTLNKIAARDYGHTVNASTMRPQMKKNMQDVSQSKKSLLQGKRTISKPKSMIESKTLQPNNNSELIESFSMPSVNPSPSEVHQYVENWLEKVSPNAEDEPELRRKVVFQIGGDSGSDETNEAKPDGRFPLTSDAVKKSTSSLSVPLCHVGPATVQHSDQYERGLCVSMPSVRHDPSHQESRLRLHQSVHAFGASEGASTSQTLSSKERMKPVMQQLCSSVQCIQRASDTSMTTNLEKATSMPDFSMQVASVFGSSCRAFLSFLSVVTLRDNLSGGQPKSMSEAKIMMESLQKISTIDDEEEQRASLTELQSRTSSQFREHWMDFQTLRERLQSEPLSPRVSETEFALDVVSEGGDAFEDQHSVIDELMEELKMPQDLRAEISSTIQHSKFFYPADESTLVEAERSQSESEIEDVEKFVDECENDSTASSLPSPPHPNEDMTETEKNHQGKVQETGTHVTEVSQTERDKPLNEHQDEDERVDLDRKNVIKDEDEETNGINDSEETEWEEKEKDVVQPETESGQDKWNTQTSSEEEKSEDGEGLDIGEKRVVVEAEQGSINEEDDKYKEHSSIEETDEREGEGDTEEEKGEDEADAEADEAKNEDAVGTEDRKWEGVTVEADESAEEEGEGEGEKLEGNISHEESEEGGDEVKEVTELTEEEEESEMMEDVIEGMEEDGVDSVSEEQDEDDKDEEVEEGKYGEEAVAREEESTQEEEEREEEGVGSAESFEIKDPEESVIEPEEIELPQFDKFAQEEDRSSDGKGSKTEEEEVNVETSGKKEERRVSEENNSTASSEGSEHAKGEGTAGEEEERSVSDDADQTDAGQHLKSLNLDFQANAHSNRVENAIESPSKYSSEGQCEDDKGNGTDSVNETETDEERDHCAGSSSDFPHPVEISQELLDFVNSALQSSSLIFTYDSHGNVRLEPDKVRAVKTDPSAKPKVRKNSTYGLKRLPSPVTSDLSDYRPETSESGGYKSQDSVDILTESGEDSPEKPSLGLRSKTHVPNGYVKAEQANGDSFSSFDSDNKASREDLSYFSAGSSLRTDAGPGTGARQGTSSGSKKESLDGVLIDRGRWLLKENHLIRRSPPQALGMYGNIDSSSLDTSQDNISEGSLPHNQTQHNNPLVAISSSELEEMAKPRTPKCTYYNMPHGSDSDPFDDASLKSADKGISSGKKRGFKVSPTIDTTKTWASENGSLSSFTSVEFKIPDGKVHPEGESSAALKARRTSSGRAQVLQPPDSWDSLHMRCSQYCPIL